MQELLRTKQSQSNPLISSSAISVKFFSIDDSKFGHYVDCINLLELGIKNTRKTARTASFFDLHLEFDSEK